MGKEMGKCTSISLYPSRGDGGTSFFSPVGFRAGWLTSMAMDGSAVVKPAMVIRGDTEDVG